MVRFLQNPTKRWHFSVVGAEQVIMKDSYGLSEQRISRRAELTFKTSACVDIGKSKSGALIVVKASPNQLPVVVIGLKRILSTPGIEVQAGIRRIFKI